METEHQEISIAIQNGFFNEGIYRITEESDKISIKTNIPESEKKEIIEKTSPPQQVISVSEESNINLTNKELIKQPEQKTDKNPIEINEPAKHNEQVPKAEFFGDNKKGVAIMVNYPDERWIYFKDKIILERILASIKLTFEDVALINTHFFKPESIDELSDTINVSKLIGFGINDQFLKEFKREEPIKTSKIALFLMNSDLDEIAMNVDKKRILWNNIKVMFNII